jgi:hypothetical protein
LATTTKNGKISFATKVITTLSTYSQQPNPPINHSLDLLTKTNRLALVSPSEVMAKQWTSTQLDNRTIASTVEKSVTSNTIVPTHRNRSSTLEHWLWI